MHVSCLEARMLAASFGIFESGVKRFAVGVNTGVDVGVLETSGDGERVIVR